MLTDAAHRRAEAVASQQMELVAKAREAHPAHPFAAALRRDHIAVIAEVKRASPSKGPIAPGLDATAQALSYVQGGAAAISVLTEPDKFGGSLADLAAVSARVTAVAPVPVIRKDFIVHPVQLWEARAAGASAALLIVRALPQDLLQRLVDTAQDAALHLLVEIRDELELERALAVGAPVIGVNNRNLETLVIDVATAPRVIAGIPQDVVAVAESGMRAAADVTAAAHAGADAILVGSAISASATPGDDVRTLAAIPRRAASQTSRPCR